MYYISFTQLLMSAERMVPEMSFLLLRSCQNQCHRILNPKFPWGSMPPDPPTSHVYPKIVFPLEFAFYKESVSFAESPGLPTCRLMKCMSKPSQKEGMTHMLLQLNCPCEDNKNRFDQLPIWINPISLNLTLT